eukprot:365738-Chlamydomonas_euryale.AAC.18
MARRVLSLPVSCFSRVTSPSLSPCSMVASKPHLTPRRCAATATAASRQSQLSVRVARHGQLRGNRVARRKEGAEAKVRPSVDTHLCLGTASKAAVTPDGAHRLCLGGCLPSVARALRRGNRLRHAGHPRPAVAAHSSQRPPSSPVARGGGGPAGGIAPAGGGAPTRHGRARCRILPGRRHVDCIAAWRARRRVPGAVHAPQRRDDATTGRGAADQGRHRLAVRPEVWAPRRERLHRHSLHI